jgi:shikimate kinase
VSKTKVRPIFLIGPMGAGKSTVGRVLADNLERRFVDSDQEIERRVGQTIAQIFASDGEAAFRLIEADTIEALSHEPAVIALGGGALTSPGVLEKLVERGDLVYLRASVDVLMARIGDPASRPLLAGLDDETRRAGVAAMLEERRGLYERAKYVVDADGDAKEVARRIAEALAGGS